MAIKSRDLVGIAEGIRSHELSTKSQIENLERQISELSGRRTSLLSTISYLEAAIAAAYEDTDEDDDPDYGLIASLEAQLRDAEMELSDVERELDKSNDDLEDKKVELKDVEEEKEKALFEVQERARKTSNNISLAGGMYGDYSGVGDTLQSSFQTSFSALEQAAGILGGSVMGISKGSPFGSIRGKGGSANSNSTGTAGSLAGFTTGSYGKGTALSSSRFTTSQSGSFIPTMAHDHQSGGKNANDSSSQNYITSQSANEYVLGFDANGTLLPTAPNSLEKYQTRQMSRHMSVNLANGVNTAKLTHAQREKYQTEVTAIHCHKSREIADKATIGGIENGLHDDMGKNFTNHTEEHLQQVLTKTNEAADTFVTAIFNNKISTEHPRSDVEFGWRIDRRVLDLAALSHDMGMSNQGYAIIDGKFQKQNPRKFNEVRENHSLNSAMRVLEKREKLISELGLTDEQVDRIALECFAHSKSASGIRNLNDSHDWETGIKTLNNLVSQYKKDNKECGRYITFGGDTFLLDKETLGQIATETLALRVGDVSRDSGPNATCQSGENVFVDKTAGFNRLAKNWKEEAESIAVKRNGTPITDCKSRQVHAGEQNIVLNKTFFSVDRGIVHEIQILDANFAPLCTFEAIKDHIGEFASAKDGRFSLEIKLGKTATPGVKEQYIAALEDYIDQPDPKERMPENIGVEFIS